jgi:hypothetical protein
MTAREKFKVGDRVRSKRGATGVVVEPWPKEPTQVRVRRDRSGRVTSDGWLYWDVIERDPVAELSDLLRDAGARPTLDMERSTALPCVRCHTTSEPRDLVRIGTYTRPMGGGLRPGDAITRPMCKACVTTTEPT